MLKVRTIESNQVTLTGKVHTEFTFSHEIMGEGFYCMEILVQRLSGCLDRIPVMLSERIADISKNHMGVCVKINGQIRSYNVHEGEHSKLNLFVFARELEWTETTTKILENKIYLDGSICRKPIYRITPMGREITDIILAVNRPYERSDYVPCICWGRNAKYASEFQVSDRIIVRGRIQSRDYTKRLEDGREETKTAYEISASQVRRKGAGEE